MPSIGSRSPVSVDLFVGFAPEDRLEADSLIGKLIGRFDIGHIRHCDALGPDGLEERIAAGIEKCRMAVLLTSRAWPLSRLLADEVMNRARRTGKPLVVLQLDGGNDDKNPPPSGIIFQPDAAAGSSAALRPLRANRLVENAISKLLEIAARVERGGLAEAPHFFAGPTLEPMARTLPPRQRLFGREPELAQITAALDRDEPSTVLIDGNGGTGKTALLGATVHAPALAARFGLRRCFVPMTGARQIDQALGRLAASLGLDPARAGFGDIRCELERRPILIAADDLGRGMSHRTDNDHLIDALAELMRNSKASLVATVPAMVSPDVGNFTRLALDGLDEHSLRNMLFNTARGIAAIDSGLEQLIAGLRGNPLALRVVASACRHDPSLAGVGRKWSHAAARLGDMASPRSTALMLALDDAGGWQRLWPALWALAQAPLGLRLDTLSATVPDGGFLAIVSLLGTGLVDMSGERVRLTPGLAEVLPAVRRAMPERAADDSRSWNDMDKLAGKPAFDEL